MYMDLSEINRIDVDRSKAKTYCTDESLGGRRGDTLPSSLSSEDPAATAATLIGSACTLLVLLQRQHLLQHLLEPLLHLLQLVLQNWYLLHLLLQNWYLQHLLLQNWYLQHLLLQLKWKRRS